MTILKHMLTNRNFSYKTATEESLNDLISTAKKEKYYDMHKDIFTELEKDIAHSLDQDLTLFRSEITELIEDEIITRYFYEEGAIAYTIRKDEQVQKALEVLNNKEKYTSILNGTAGSILITKKNEKEISKPNLQVNRKNEAPI